MAAAVRAMQVLLQHARRARAAPESALFGTHRIVGPVASIDTGAIFPDRAIPITFAQRILITGAAASGIIFEFGNATTGAKLAIDGGEIYLAAGAASGDGGVAGSVAIPALAVGGSELRLVLTLVPGSGRAALYSRGAAVLTLQSAEAWATWAADDAGAIGAAAAGTGSTQRGQAINAAPDDFVLAGPFRAFAGQQVPRAWL